MTCLHFSAQRADPTYDDQGRETATSSYLASVPFRKFASASAGGNGRIMDGLEHLFFQNPNHFLSTTPPPLITDGALVGGVKAMPSYNCTNCGAEEIFLYETPSAHLILRIIEQGKACNSTQALLLKALEPITTPMEEVMGMSIEREAGSSTQDLLKALEPITTPDELALV